MVPSCLIIDGLGLGEEPSSDCNLKDWEVGSVIYIVFCCQFVSILKVVIDLQASKRKSLLGCRR